MIGETGSHKSGLAIMLALNAIEEQKARVLYIAAEGALGIEKYRVPKAWRVRGNKLQELDAFWRTEDETPDLSDPRDVDALIKAYRDQDFIPDIVFIDVLTLVAGASNINETHDATRLRAGRGHDRARVQRATVVLIHHPSRRGMSGGGSGSATLWQLAYFQLDVYYDERREVVKLFVKKAKDGKSSRSVYSKKSRTTPKTPSTTRSLFSVG